MPIYEYRCQQCGHELEKLQKMSDPSLVDCPACESASLQRLISAAGFRLKGGGWYETDFKSSGKRNIADSGNETPATAGKEPSTTSSPKKEKSSGTADTTKTPAA